MQKRISMTIAYTAEEREDRWAFHVQDFGFILYGETEEDGQQVTSDAVKALMEALNDDWPRLTKYLDDHGVSYGIQNIGDSMPDYSGKDVKSIQFEEAFSAAAP